MSSFPVRQRSGVPSHKSSIVVLSDLCIHFHGLTWDLVDLIVFLSSGIGSLTFISICHRLEGGLHVNPTLIPTIDKTHLIGLDIGDTDIGQRLLGG